MKLSFKGIIAFLVICCLTISCERKTSSKSYSFYHWKTTLENSDAQNEVLQRSGGDRLYVRMFDLKVDPTRDQVLPVGTVQIPDSLTLMVQEIVPVVYIKNEVFSHPDSDEENLEILVENTTSKLARLLSWNLKNYTIKEIQIDCDWTDRTKERYFSFLQALKASDQFKGLGNEFVPHLSATIRWHQVKYRERTGVPPVDRGLIMAYNVGELASVEESNSIINNITTQQYVARLKDYPIGYDVALPLFEWYAQYRNNELVALINEIDSAVLNRIAQSTGNHLYTISKEYASRDSYFYQDDILRKETVDFEKLKQLSVLIKKNSTREYRTIFYHINSPLLNEFTHNQLSQIVL